MHPIGKAFIIYVLLVRYKRLSIARKNTIRHGYLLCMIIMQIFFQREFVKFSFARHDLHCKSKIFDKINLIIINITIKKDPQPYRLQKLNLLRLETRNGHSNWQKWDLIQGA